MAKPNPYLRARGAFVIIRSLSQSAKAGQERDALNEIAMHANNGIRHLDDAASLKDRVMLRWRRFSAKWRIRKRQRPPGSLINDVKQKAAEGYIIGHGYCKVCNHFGDTRVNILALHPGQEDKPLECGYCYRMTVSFTKIDDLDTLDL
jgi:hypothetical protein